MQARLSGDRFVRRTVIAHHAAALERESLLRYSQAPNISWLTSPACSLAQPLMRAVACESFYVKNPNLTLVDFDQAFGFQLMQHAGKVFRRQRQT